MTETKHKHDKTGAIRLKGCPECNPDRRDESESERDFQGPDALMVRAAPAMYEALRETADQLEAWAETEDLKARHMSDADAEPHINRRNCYMFYVVKLRAALAQADGR